MLPVLLAAGLAAGISLASDPAPQRSAEAAQAAATSTVAVPATATSATTPPPCENGTAVPSPADNPGLVADCTVLLAAEATLAGTATLNWSADRAITAWTGVTVASVPYGAPERVTTLDLQSGSLNGSIPAALGDLSALRELRLQWNQLTGSIPAALGDLTQLTYLGLGGNQLSGAIPPALGAIGSTLTTLHLTGPSPLPSGIGLTGAIPPALGNLTGLQHLWLDGNALTGPIPTRLRWLTDLRGLNLNKNQLTGAIPTQLGALTKLRELRLENNQLAGAIPTQLADLRSLRKAYLKNNSGLSGCVPRGLGDVRFNDAARLNLPTCPAGTPPTPATPLPTYALTITATGGGSVNPGGTTMHDEDSAVTLRASWNDATHSFTAWGGACSGGATSCELTMDADQTVTATFAALPADRCSAPGDADCLRAVYRGAPGDYAQVVDIPADVLVPRGADGRYTVERGQQVTVVTAAPLPTAYTRFYLQRRALEMPSPTSYERLIPPVGTTYTFTPTADAAGPTLITFDLTAARPRPLPRPGQKPELGAVVASTVFQVAATTLRYTAYDTTGAATIQGSYAFLEDPDDTSTAVSTYEGLRDGSTTALLVHQADAYGASQAALYDAVETGDLVEWRQASDCFVRYQVTEVKPDPTGTVPRTLLAVAWMTYAFAGCTGAVATTTAATLDWSDLPDLGGTSLTTPIRHGPHQIVPEGWTGVTEDPETHYPTSYSPFTSPTYMSDPDPAVASALPYWREPALPAGWSLHTISRGRVSDPPFGYTASYSIPGEWVGVRISGSYDSDRGWAEEASWSNGGGVYETRMIDGRPARVMYSPPGPNHAPLFPLTVWIYDPATQTEYAVYGYARSLLGSNVDAVVAIARSLFESPNPQ